MVEFEDGLRTGVLLEAACALRGAAPSLGSIPNPPGGAGLSWGSVAVRQNSRSAEFRASVVFNRSCYVVLGLNRL